jgi:Flp pilus assembly protein TadD
LGVSPNAWLVKESEGSEPIRRGAEPPHRGAHGSRDRATNAPILNPDHFNALNNPGTALVAQGRFNEAVEHYEYALTISPQHPRTNYNPGIALAELGRIADAVVQYRRALALKPDYAEAHNNPGNLLLAQGVSREATGHYKASAGGRSGACRRA